MLFHLGCAYGEAIVKTLQPNLKTQDPAKIIAYLAEYGKAGGWGVYEMERINNKSEHVVTIKDNAFFDMKGGCYFVKGTLKGLVDAALPSQKRHKIEEVKHSSKECEFEMMLG